MPEQTMQSRFDLDLFEVLEREYRKRPLRDAPVPRDEESFRDKAAARVKTIQRQLDTEFEDKIVLELGCGHGWLTAFLPEVAGASKAIGVDPRRYDTWDEHTDPRVELIEADMAVQQVVEPESVDLIVSGAVLEHVTRPVQMLDALPAALRPGRRAWLVLHR